MSVAEQSRRNRRSRSLYMELFLDLIHPCSVTSLLAKLAWDESVMRKWQEEQKQQLWQGINLKVSGKLITWMS